MRAGKRVPQKKGPHSKGGRLTAKRTMHNKAFAVQFGETHGNDRFAEPNVAVRTLPGGVARRRLCRANYALCHLLMGGSSLFARGAAAPPQLLILFVIVLITSDLPPLKKKICTYKHIFAPSQF
jgi:hypothetical protein